MRKENVYLVSHETFIETVKTSKNVHEALKKMGLSTRGTAYKIFKLRCSNLNLDLSHFTNDKTIRATLPNDQVTEAVKKNISRIGALKQIGINPHVGANVLWIDKKIKKLHLDTSHWKGMSHLKGQSHNWKESKPLSEICVENSNYLNTTQLKNKLLKAKIFKYNCLECGINEWNGKPLSLHLDHINGNNIDNRIENLRLLCPNCHSQTPTYCKGKNASKKNPSNKISQAKQPKPKYKFCDCGQEIQSKSKMCMDCSRKTTKIKWPSAIELKNMVLELGYCETGRVLGVSDNAIRKHMKRPK